MKRADVKAVIEILLDDYLNRNFSFKDSSNPTNEESYEHGYIDGLIRSTRLIERMLLM